MSTPPAKTPKSPKAPDRSRKFSDPDDVCCRALIKGLEELEARDKASSDHR